MDKKQIQEFIDHCRFNDSCNDSRLIETHISWIVLTDNYAYKFKRPVEYSFVDFSTMELREKYCNLEVDLNRRLSPDMYLGVVPVTANGIKEDADSENDEIIDHAVKMKRMDDSKRMDKLLKQGNVDRNDIEKLAKKLALFHSEARIVKNAFKTNAFQEKYRDLLSVGDYIKEQFGDKYLGQIKEVIDQSYNYLNKNRNFMNHRVINNFQRDCHGDLNSTNIFLYDEPVIFDCIDFNKEFRVIDLLNEIAFLSVDLDFYGYTSFGDQLYNSYMQAYGAGLNKENELLYTYYKSYRANIRAKVTAISASKSNSDDKSGEVKTYLDLMIHYADNLTI